MATKVQEKLDEFKTRLLEEFDNLDIIDASPKQIREALGIEQLGTGGYKSMIEGLERRGDIKLIKHPESKRSMIYFTDPTGLKDSGLKMCLIEQPDGSWSPERHLYHSAKIDNCTILPPDKWAIKEKVYNQTKPRTPKANKLKPTIATEALSMVYEDMAEVRNEPESTVDPDEIELNDYWTPNIVNDVLITYPNGTTQVMKLGSDSCLYLEDLTYVGHNTKREITEYWYKTRKPLDQHQLKDRALTSKKTWSLDKGQTEQEYLFNKAHRTLHDEYGMQVGKYPHPFLLALIYVVGWVAQVVHNYLYVPYINWYRNHEAENKYCREKGREIKANRKAEMKAEARNARIRAKISQNSY